MKKREGIALATAILFLVLWYVLKPIPDQGGPCSMGDQDPFQPGTLDVVINYVNFTNPSRQETQPGQCGLCGRLQCDPASATPCCRGWHSPDKIPGTCGTGPEFCACPNCLDSRVVGTDRSYGEIRWLLRGIDKHIGIWSDGDQLGLVRNIYLVYNTLEGNGPPDFIEWIPCPFRNALRHADCKATVYVSARSPSLVAVPQCFYFPPGSPPYGQSRDASQIGVHRIANLSKWFLYFEDDMVPISRFRPSDFVDYRNKKTFTYLDVFYLFEHFQSSNWAKSKLYTINLFTQKFGWRIRFAEGSHVPLLANRCAMEEVENTWNPEFLFTIKDGEGPNHLQFQTACGVYAQDKGWATNRIISSHSAQVHLNLEGKYDDPLDIFCDLADNLTPFAQIQGPSYSDEMTMCGPPRADWRLVIDGFLHYTLPEPSRFESPDEAKAFNARPRSHMSWPCPKRPSFTTFRASVVLLALLLMGLALRFYRKLRPRARED